MWKFNPLCCGGSLKPAALLEGRWRCVFPFAWWQHLYTLCLDHAVPATAWTQFSRQPQPQQADKKQQLPKTGEERLHLCRSARQARLQPAEEWECRLQGGELRWLCRCCRERLPCKGKHGRKHEPSRGPGGSCHPPWFVPTGCCGSGALPSAAPRQGDVG